MSLKQYQARRNFKQTAEPAGRDKSRRSRGGRSRFVVQKHAASHLHYDFRLEMDGVLKSWAVPKGFPTRHGDRRLAVQVEDHPLDYANFEGTIAPGNYGAGTVMVWDKGSYEVMGGEPRRALEQGKLHLTACGHEVKGRMDARQNAPARRYGPDAMVVVEKRRRSPAHFRTCGRSVSPERAVAQTNRISRGGPQWRSNRQTTPAKPGKDRNRTPLRTPSVGRNARTDFRGTIRPVAGGESAIY